jgi:hypothetical protein
MYINTPEVRSIIARAFPAYNGRSISVQPFHGPMRLDSYWSGGSRDYWTAVHLATGQTAPVPENGTPFTPAIGQLEELPENTVLVCWSRVGGGTDYVTVYVRPENLTKMLPAPVALTEREAIVIEYTCSYKNTYGGRTNIRFAEASERTGITVEQWEVAKASCIVRGLLNKAGAVTDAGRNARVK